MRSFNIAWRLVLSILAAVLVLFIGYKTMTILATRPPEVSSFSFKESQRVVAVKPVVYEARELELSSMGRVLASQTATLAAEAGGEILSGSVPLKVGQAFRKGQVLFKIDEETARLALFARKSNFQTTIATLLPDLKIDFPEAFQKWNAYFEALSMDESLSALPEVSNTREKVFFSSKGVFNQYYDIKSEEERLSRYVVRAPFDGAVWEVLLETGSRAAPNSQVVRIIRAGQVEVEAPVPVNNLKTLKVGMKVLVQDEAEQQEWAGRIARVGAKLDPATQSVNLYVRFQPGSTKILDGQYLKVVVPGTQVREVMAIPRSALFNQNQVYTVEDSLLRIRSVKIETLSKEAVYFSGLPKGELVVVEPLINAYDQMRVLPEQVENSSPAESALNTPQKGKKQFSDIDIRLFSSSTLPKD
ncbi:MAG: efflux RND transporter periplasmic adaptor subunit [Bacteroidota bacterium]